MILRTVSRDKEMPMLVDILDHNLLVIHSERSPCMMCELTEYENITEH